MNQLSVLGDMKTFVLCMKFNRILVSSLVTHLVTQLILDSS